MGIFCWIQATSTIDFAVSKAASYVLARTVKVASAWPLITKTVAMTAVAISATIALVGV